MKKILLLSFLLLAFAVVQAQTNQASPYVEGVVRVKLKPSAESFAQSMTLQPSGSAIARSGMQRFDALNKQFKATSMRRIFPYAGKYEEKHRRYGLHLWYEIAIDTKADPKAASAAYLSEDLIELAEPVYAIQSVYPEGVEDVQPEFGALALPSNDPRFANQWHYNNTGQVTPSVVGADINLLNAWDVTMGDSTVIVAITDGGIDTAHADLKANLWTNSAGEHGYNFVSNTVTLKAHGHGTHVAGTVSAVNNNSIGVAGVAGGHGVVGGKGTGARLMSCQIMETNTAPGATGDVLARNPEGAFIYAADNGAVISQNSWGYTTPGAGKDNIALREAIRYFIENAGTDHENNLFPNAKMRGGIVIFASGNNSDKGGMWYPAAWDEVVAVTSIDPSGIRAPYANIADWVDISAPGGHMVPTNSRGVYSTFPGNSYGLMNGTSMACPHVSGVAALILAKYGHANYTPDSLRMRLLGTAKSLVPYDPTNAPYMGIGLLNAGKAVEAMVPTTGITLSRISVVDSIDIRLQLTAVIAPANSTIQSVTWESSNPTIASVDKTGKVTMLKAGNAVVTAKSLYSNTVKGTCAITVIPKRVSAIGITPSTATIMLGKKTMIKVTITPSNASDQTVLWTSSNPAIAEIDPITGIITGLSAGTTTLTATTQDGGFVATCTLAVLQPITGIELAPSATYLLVGGKAALTPVFSPANAGNKKIMWSSDKWLIAEVDENGVVTGLTDGTATVTAKTEDGGHVATAVVKVYSNPAAPEGFSPNGDNINDVFAFALNTSETYSLRIFDRSGQQYYTSADYKNDWSGVANTGAHNGERVPTGTYYYVLTAKSTGVATKGFVAVRY